MGISDQLEHLSHALNQAPFVEDGWLYAMRRYALLTNATVVQFAGWSADRNVFNSHVQPEFRDTEATWRHLRGDDPAQNPIVSHGIKRELLSPYCDNEAFIGYDKSRHPVWQDVYKKAGMESLANNVINRNHKALSFIVAIRTARQGEFDAEDLRVVARAGYLWKTSLDIAGALRDENERFFTSALDVACVAGFIIDENGCVRFTTAAAEPLLDHYFLSNHHKLLELLSTPHDAVQVAIDKCQKTNRPEIIYTPARDGHVLRFSISQLPPNRTEFVFGPAILVTCEIAKREPDYTLAERDVANALCKGKSLSAIADARSTSIETIKSQSKAVYAKANVAGQIELMLEYPNT